MTALDAYLTLKEQQDDKKKLIEAKDFGKFFGFIFADSDEPFGGAYDCVNKDTGEIFSFNAFDDFAVFRKGKNLNIEMFKTIS